MAIIDGILEWRFEHEMRYMRVLLYILVIGRTSMIAIENRVFNWKLISRKQCKTRKLYMGEPHIIIITIAPRCR